jgi:hypothetical protein
MKVRSMMMCVGLTLMKINDWGQPVNVIGNLGSNIESLRAAMPPRPRIFM